MGRSEMHPKVPEAATRPYPHVFLPWPAMTAFLGEVFIDPGGAFHHPKHLDLLQADIGVLVTNAPYEKKGRRVLGTMELADGSGQTTWLRHRKVDMWRRLFGRVPDFVMTLDGFYMSGGWGARKVSPEARCAVLHHELRHGGVQINQRTKAVAYDKLTGKPKYKTHPHELEIFVSEVEMFGAYSPALQELKEALERGPRHDPAFVAGVCGCGMPIVA